MLSTLPEKTEKLNKLKSDMDSVSKEIASAQEINGKIKDYERYEELLSMGVTAKNKAEEIKVLYGGNVPSKGEIKYLSESLIKERELSASVTALTESELQEYSKLKDKFNGKDLSSESLTNVETNIDKLNKLVATVEYSNAKKSTERETALDSKFAKNLPSKTLVEDADNCYNKYRELKTELDELSRAREVVLTESKKPLKFYLPLAVLFLVGIGLIFLNLYVGLIVSILSLVGVVAVALYYSSKQKSVGGSVETASLRIKVSDLENKLGYILSMYGYSIADGISYSYNSFKRDLSDYLDVLSARSEEGKNLDKLQTEIDNIKGCLTEFFATYFIVLNKNKVGF